MTLAPQQARSVGRRMALPAAAALLLSVAAIGSCASRPTPVRVLGSPQAPTTSTIASAACPAATNPPNAPYQVAIKGKLTGQVDIKDTGVPNQDGIVPDVSATLCGVIALPSQTATVLPANLIFKTFHLHFGITQVTPIVATALGPSLTTVSAQPAANGGLDLTVTSSIHQHITIGSPPNLLNCDISPVNMTLSTRGSVTDVHGVVVNGVALTGPLNHATATLVGSGFTIPPAPPTPACPDGLTLQIFNGELALPNNHTTIVAQLSLSVSAR